MAASVIAAVKARLASFTYAAPTGVFFDEVPVNVNGARVAPPYVVLKDDGLTTRYTAEYKVWEETRLRVEAYALDLDDVDAIAEVVKYNGGLIDAGAGLDFAADIPVTGQDYKGCVREGSPAEQRSQEQDRTDPDAYVFRVTLRYVVSMQR